MPSSTLPAPNGLDIQAIHPDGGARYSPNLYRWLTTRNRGGPSGPRATLSRVFVDAEGTMWIGRLEGGELIGARMISVLCEGQRAQTACWVTLRGLREIPDFWRRYMADGRCAIDPDHSMNFAHDAERWDVEGDSRSCRWCGKVRQMMVRSTDAAQRHEWRQEPAGAAA